MINRKQFTATIASGQTTSGAVFLEGATPALVITPAEMTGNTLTFQVSNDGTNFYPFYDSATAVSVTIATNAARAYRLTAAEWLGFQAIKIVSSGTEAAARTLTIVCADF